MAIGARGAKEDSSNFPGGCSSEGKGDLGLSNLIHLDRLLGGQGCPVSMIAKSGARTHDSKLLLAMPRRSLTDPIGISVAS